MHNKAVDELYNQIKDLKSKEEFHSEIKKRKKECDDLFDEEILALLIVDELGRNKTNVSDISALKEGDETTVFGKVTNVFNSRTFNRKNGSCGKVANLELTDNTGKCGLALWDRDVELVKNKTIKVGTNLKVINGYVKNGFSGIEINVGRWSLLELEPDGMQKIDSKNLSFIEEIQGELIDIQPTKAFFKDDGEFGFVSNIKLKNKENTHLISVWGKKVKEIQKFKKGDKIKIENVDIKEKNGSKELHLNGKGKIKKI